MLGHCQHNVYYEEFLKHQIDDTRLTLAAPRRKKKEKCQLQPGAPPVASIDDQIPQVQQPEPDFDAEVGMDLEHDLFEARVNSEVPPCV